MLRIRIVVLMALVMTLVGLAPAQPPAPKGPDSQRFNFRMQEIDKSLKVGYAVVLADVNGDSKLDIVVVDTNEVVWYENPTWQKRVIIRDQTKLDNVCIAAADIDGDGKVDFAIGADWGRGFRTKEGSTIQWVKRGASLEDRWAVHPISADVPTVHRMKFVDLFGDGKQHLVVAPLMGQDASRGGNWSDGQPVRILAYPIPADPVAGPWKPVVLDQTLHVVHGISSMKAENRKGFDILAASYEGVSLISPVEGSNDRWAARRIAAGNQDVPSASRGSSEVKAGKLKNNQRFLATIEPWHGNQVVCYTPADVPEKLWDRQVVDSKLKWGHAVWCADLDGDGVDEMLIGVRDDPQARTDTFSDRRGLRVYVYQDDSKRWDRQLVDQGGVAVEDLAAGDLNGDGRADIVCVGRHGNVRIYFNEK